MRELGGLHSLRFAASLSAALLPATVIYGGMHLQRRNLLSNYELVDDPHLHTLVQQLEREGDTHVFTVWPTARIDLQVLQPDVSSWPVPSLVPVRGTLLGTADFAAFYPGEGAPLDVPGRPDRAGAP